MSLLVGFLGGGQESSAANRSPSAEFSNASVGCVDFALAAREACSHCLCVKIQVTWQQGVQR